MRIDLFDVTRYFGERRALGPVGLQFRDRGLTVVGGPNGAGKSVLLKVLAGILRPTSGQLLWDGRPAQAELNAYKFRIGYMPQAPTFYEEQTVATTLRYFARLKAIPARWVAPRVVDVLRLVHLEDLARRRVRHLSGGERSRLALGIALLNDPDLLLLDEPAANLDPSERRQLWDLIGTMREGRAVVIATHVFAGLEDVADRLLVLEAGRVLCDAPVASHLEQIGRHVWEVTLPAATEPNWQDTARVVWRRRSGDSIVWHVLAATCPAAGAERAQPTLDDVYLWLRWRARVSDELLPEQVSVLSSPSPS